MLGASLGCILGLFVGGILGIVPVVLLYEIRSGRIKVPPKISLGPLRLDTSGLAKPSERPEGAAPDLSDVAPVVDTGGSIAAGCLTLISAGLVLLGFILPWFTCNIAGFIEGSFSGVTQLVTMLVTLLTTVFGGLSAREPESLAASGVVALLYLVVIAFLAVIPLIGLYIGFLGFRLMTSLMKPRQQRGRLSRLLIAAGLLGLVPVCCYITSASAVPNVKLDSLFPGLPGIEVQTTGSGLWVTLAGFAAAIVAGFTISVTVALAEQMIRPSPAADETGTLVIDEGEHAVQ